MRRRPSSLCGNAGKPENLSGKDLPNLDLAGVDFRRTSLNGAFSI
jgi:uncharacterized protein YjbI with pentapeptide repeats